MYQTNSKPVDGLWSTVINLLLHYAFLIFLVIASAVSFYQTADGFSYMKDDSVILFGFPIGLYLPYVYGGIVQYGQNVALYIRDNILTGKVMWTGRIAARRIVITDKTLAFWAFITCAVIDAATNCFWQYNATKSLTWSPTLVFLSVIGYLFMILIVFAEETVGWTLDSIMSVHKRLGIIMDMYAKMNPPKPKTQPSGNGQSNGQRQQQQQYSQGQPQNGSRRQGGLPADEVRRLNDQAAKEKAAKEKAAKDRAMREAAEIDRVIEERKRRSQAPEPIYQPVLPFEPDGDDDEWEPSYQ